MVTTLNASVTTWIRHLLACMGGCFGCCTKPTPIIAVDEPSKGLRIRGRTVKKPGISDDFWSSSTYDLDNSALQSQRSISSISTSNQTLTHGSVAGSTSSQSDFVNNGKFSLYAIYTVLILVWKFCVLCLNMC
ncbi:unnamed protein product [Prunus armeniaca]